VNTKYPSLKKRIEKIGFISGYNLKEDKKKTTGIVSNGHRC